MFGILCAFMMILKRFCYLKILLTNILVGIGLSIPMLCLLLQASGAFQKQESFFLNPVFYFSLMVHSMIPQGILQSVGKKVSFLDAIIMNRNDNLVLYTGMVTISLCVLFIGKSSRWVKIIGKCNNISSICEKVRGSYKNALEWPHEQKTMMGCVVTFFFFLDFMSGGLVAYVLHAMPVIRNFRYLFKAIFVAVPLAIVLFAWIVRGSVGKCRKMLVCLIILFACIGGINAYDTVQITEHLFDMRIEDSYTKEKEKSVEMIEAAHMDCKNYRTTTFYRFSGIQDECFDQTRNLSRNYPTALGVFSLSGYEIATEDERLEEFDKIYSEKDFFAKYANADSLKNLYMNLETEPDKVQRQLIDNSVRYLLLDKTALKDNSMVLTRKNAQLEKDYREKVITTLRSLPEVQVIDVREFNEHYDLVEIDGVNSLCMDSAGNMVPLRDLNMQTVSFQAQQEEKYTLSLAYDKYLTAFLKEEDGKKQLLSIERMENDNILISTKDACGEVILTYRNPVCIAGFIWEGIVSILFVLHLLCFYTGKNS